MSTSRMLPLPLWKRRECALEGRTNPHLITSHPFMFSFLYFSIWVHIIHVSYDHNKAEQTRMS